MHIIGVWAGSKGSVKNVWKFWNFFKNENFSEDKLSTQTLILLYRYLLYACRTAWNYVLLRQMQFLRFIAQANAIFAFFYHYRNYSNVSSIEKIFCRWWKYHISFLSIYFLIRMIYKSICVVRNRLCKKIKRYLTYLEKIT